MTLPVIADMPVWRPYQKGELEQGGGGVVQNVLKARYNKQKGYGVHTYVWRY